MPPEKVIAVVDPYSSGALLAAEIKRRGEECVCVQSTETVPEMYRSSFRKDDFAEHVLHRGDVPQTAAQLRLLGTHCVLAGCELGVELADRLGERLGTASNGTALSQARRNKFLMAQTVRKHGFRTPDQFCACTLDDLRQRMRGHLNWPVVVKPLESTGSDGVRLCESAAAVGAVFQDIMQRRNAFGEANAGVLVQQFLDGPEYAVDTVSYAGRHKVAAYWRYGRPVASAPSLGTDSFELLPFSDRLHGRLFDYVQGVLDSLAIKHGPAHCEIICPGDSPVLVEVGARLNGGQNPLISRYCGGRCQVELTLDAYLTPERFLADLDQPYRLTMRGMRVFLLPGRTGRLTALPRLREIEALESFREMHISAKRDRPLSRIAGWVILIHPDKSVLDRDRQRIRYLETAGLYRFEEPSQPVR